MSIHEHAASGFARAADAYERGRPSYPPDAVRLLVAQLDLRPGRTLLDLAAGTGKMTRLLAPSGCRIVAVEPVDAMRAVLERELPDVDARSGTAEALPLPADAVDAAVVAQAFHWFDGPRALAELHRVLRRRGRLALVWNALEAGGAPWLAAVQELVDAAAGDTPRYGSGRWQDAFGRTPLFEPLRHATLPNPVETSVDTLVDRIVSISYVAALPSAERDAFEAALRDVLPAEEPLRYAYRTDVYVTSAR